MSWLTGFFGYLTGNVAEYSNPEKTVGNGEGREGRIFFFIYINYICICKIKSHESSIKRVH